VRFAQWRSKYTADVQIPWVFHRNFAFRPLTVVRPLRDSPGDV
jgi:hypothetical protein